MKDLMLDLVAVTFIMAMVAISQIESRLSESRDVLKEIRDELRKMNKP